jgi:hypothetical protein
MTFNPNVEYHLEQHMTLDIQVLNVESTIKRYLVFSPQWVSTFRLYD